MSSLTPSHPEEPPPSPPTPSHTPSDRCQRDSTPCRLNFTSLCLNAAPRLTGSAMFLMCRTPREKKEAKTKITEGSQHRVKGSAVRSRYPPMFPVFFFFSSFFFCFYSVDYHFSREKLCCRSAVQTAVTRPAMHNRFWSGVVVASRRRCKRHHRRRPRRYREH